MRKIKNAHHKDGWYEVTPLDAAALLDGMTFNRALRQSNVEKIAEEIRRGAWRPNGESIVFDQHGKLIDGQHRLRACMVAGKPIVSYCVFGVSRAVFPTFDTGANRQAHDLASIMKLPNYKLVAAAARYLILYDACKGGGRWPTGAAAWIDQTAFEEYMTKNRELLIATTSAIVEHRSGLARLGRGVAVFSGVFAIAYRSVPERATSWLTLVATGEGLTAEHPVMLLRNRLMEMKKDKYKVATYEVAAICIKSFNAYCNGRRTKLLKWGSEEAFPRIDAA